MEKECPKCGNIVEATNAKGDGVHFEWYCEECEAYIEENPSYRGNLNPTRTAN